MKIVIGITGASGSIYAIRLIEVLKLAGHELHVVLTDSGEKVIQYECGKTIDDLRQMSDVLYDIHDVGAAIASGSFKMDAMVVIPCSMKTAACKWY